MKKKELSQEFSVKLLSRDLKITVINNNLEIPYLQESKLFWDE